MSFTCQTCKKYKTEKKYSLSKHLTIKHKFNKKQIHEYYDNYIKLIDEDVCKLCKSPTKFINGVKGYWDLCDSCNSKKQFKNCKEYWLLRNFSKEEANLKIKEIQKERSLKFKNKYIKDPIKYKKKSPFCYEYWLNKGYSIEQAKNIIKNNTDKATQIWFDKKEKNPEKYLHPVNKEYWLNKGYSEDEAKKNIKLYLTKQKGKCNLDWHIKKYGKTLGEQKYREYCKTRINNEDRFIKCYGIIEGKKRYKLWKQNAKAKIINIKSRGWSMISQELFWNLYKIIKKKYNNIYFATLDNGHKNNHTNKEFVVKYGKEGKFHRLDFYVEDIKKCIEYDDPKWHNEQADIIRSKNIKNVIPDIQILRISSVDYKKNKDIIIKKCLEFLYEI